MKTLEQINKKLQKQYLKNRYAQAVTWVGLQYALGKITKEQYKAALKAAKNYKKSI